RGDRDRLHVKALPPSIRERLWQVAGEQLDIARLQVRLRQDVVLDDLFFRRAGRIRRLCDGMEELLGHSRSGRDHHVASGISNPLTGQDTRRRQRKDDHRRQRGALVRAHRWISCSTLPMSQVEVCLTSVSPRRGAERNLSQGGLAPGLPLEERDRSLNDTVVTYEYLGTTLARGRRG